MKGNNKSMTEKSNMISPEEIEKQNRYMELIQAENDAFEAENGYRRN